LERKEESNLVHSRLVDGKKCFVRNDLA